MMSLAELQPLTPVRAGRAAPVLDLVVPVYKEAGGLERSIRRLHEFLVTAMPFSWRIVIADCRPTCVRCCR